MEQSKRRRKKNVYVEYDYEEAYQKQIENLEEDIIKRMMDGKKLEAMILKQSLEMMLR
mgnify:CR=1 FL=1